MEYMYVCMYIRGKRSNRKHFEECNELKRMEVVK